MGITKLKVLTPPAKMGITDVYSIAHLAKMGLYEL